MSSEAADPALGNLAVDGIGLQSAEIGCEASANVEIRGVELREVRSDEVDGAQCAEREHRAAVRVGGQRGKCLRRRGIAADAADEVDDAARIRGEVLDHIRPAARDLHVEPAAEIVDRRVGPVQEHHLVAAGEREAGRATGQVEGVGAQAADDRVVATSQADDVAVALELHGVGTAPAGDRRVAGARDDLVVAAADREHVGVAAGRDRVVAVAERDRGVAQAPGDDVRAVTPGNDIVVAREIDGQVAAAGIDRRLPLARIDRAAAAIGVDRVVVAQGIDLLRPGDALKGGTAVRAAIDDGRRRVRVGDGQVHGADGSIAVLIGDMYEKLSASELPGAMFANPVPLAV